MNAEQIQQLLDEASGLYNDGSYDEAVERWNHVLEADPGNERASEGIKMAQLLTAEWETGPEPPQEGAAPAGGPDPEITARVQEALRRVEALIASGDLRGAREGVEALQQVAPDLPAVLACAARVEAGGDPSSYIEEQLAMARHYSMLGDVPSAQRACRKVLVLEPGNAVAMELLTPGDAAGAAGGIPVSETAGTLELTNDPIPAATDPPLDLSLEEPAAEEEPLTLTETAAAGGAAATAPPGTGDPMAGAVPPPLDLTEAVPQGGDAPPGDAPEARIAALLAEGDRLRDEGDLDAAINAWSRVFVVQETHEGAEERIDAARRVLEEQGREIEAALYRGEDLLAAGQLEEAREAFQQVLALRSTHAEARARLEEIDRKQRGETTEPVPTAAPSPPATPTAPQPPHEGLSPGDSVPLAIPLAETPRTSPREPIPPAATPAPAPVRSGRLRGAVLLILAVSVLGVVGYLGWTRLFPSGPSLPATAAPASAATASTPVPAAAADPAEPEAAGPEPAEDAAPAPTAPAAAPSPERSRQLMTAGIASFHAGEFSTATEQLRGALQADATNFEAQDWLAQAEKELQRTRRFRQEVESIQNLVEERDFHNALYKLYRVDAPSPEAQRRMEAWIATCWYDWGVLLLQSRSPREAEEKLQEALLARPDDAVAQEHLEVARRYSSREVDAAYQAYVEGLSLRPLD
ncbi:MAG: hypothetical protein PVF68_16975 [Acidobacteriota bacterium]|jgi:tetratricopeptide (TPR) repeat protein